MLANNVHDYLTNQSHITCADGSRPRSIHSSNLLCALSLSVDEVPMSNQTIDCQHVVNAVQCNETTIDESNSLSCGDSLVGTNVGKGDVIGSRSPEAMYELSFVRSVSLVVTTCSRVTDFSTALLLFDSVPTPEDHYNATLLATHDEEHLCTKGGGSSLFFNGKLGVCQDTTTAP